MKKHSWIVVVVIIFLLVFGYFFFKERPDVINIPNSPIPRNTTKIPIPEPQPCYENEVEVTCKG